MTRSTTDRAAFSWVIADQILVSGSNFLTGVLIARYLGVREFGTFALAWLVVQFVGALQHAGVTMPMMTIGGKLSDSSGPGYVTVLLAHEVAFSAISFLLVWVLVAMWDRYGLTEAHLGLALPIAVATFCAQWQDFVRRFFFASGRPALAFLSDICRYVGLIALLFGVLAMSEVTTEDVLWLSAAAAAAGALFFVGNAPVGFAIDVRYFSDITRRHLRYARWNVLSVAGFWGVANFPIVMTGALLGPEPVGGLRATQALLATTHIFYLGLDNVVLKRAAQEYAHGGEHTLINYLQKVWIIGLVVTLIIGGIFALAPSLWLNLIYGEMYVEYDRLVWLWLAYYCMHYTCMCLGYGLLSLEFTQKIFIARFIGSLLSIPLSILLVIAFGAYGTMISIIASESLVAFHLARSCKRRGLFQPAAATD